MGEASALFGPLKMGAGDRSSRRIGSLNILLAKEDSASRHSLPPICPYIGSELVRLAFLRNLLDQVLRDHDAHHHVVAILFYFNAEKSVGRI